MSHNGLSPRRGAHMLYEDYGIEFPDDDLPTVQIVDVYTEDQATSYDEVKTWLDVTFSIWWVVWTVVIIAVLCAGT